MQVYIPTQKPQVLAAGSAICTPSVAYNQELAQQAGFSNQMTIIEGDSKCKWVATSLVVVALYWGYIHLSVYSILCALGADYFRSLE